MRREMATYQHGVGRRLKALRQAKTATQEDAAQIADVSLTTWRNWERGLRAPYERNWRKLQAGFELTDDQVAAIRGTPPTPLGLGAESQVTEGEQQILSVLDDIIERLERLERRPPGEAA